MEAPFSDERDKAVAPGTESPTHTSTQVVYMNRIVLAFCDKGTIELQNLVALLQNTSLPFFRENPWHSEAILRQACMPAVKIECVALWDCEFLIILIGLSCASLQVHGPVKWLPAVSMHNLATHLGWYEFLSNGHFCRLISVHWDG